jgi:Rap1a immunity proteins
MFQLLRGIALIAAMILTCEVAFAKDYSGNDMILHCRELVGNVPKEGSSWYQRGLCDGAIDALSYVSQGINSCFPQGVTNKQLRQVVAQYIDKQPARLHEPFNKLALEALHEAWPCKK